MDKLELLTLLRELTVAGSVAEKLQLIDAAIAEEAKKHPAPKHAPEKTKEV